jgi:dTMP kinase
MITPKTLDKGFLVSFEGIEGSGKSTQIQLLAHALSLRGYHVVVTREPGGTSLAESIRGLFLSHKIEKISSRTELLLLLAARSDHIQKVITPALSRGDVVLVDRFIDASVAYQGYGRQLGGNYIRDLHQSLDLWLVPQRTFFLDLPLELSFRRIALRSAEPRDRIESESVLFFERVRQGYKESAELEYDRYRTVDACLAMELLHETLLAYLLRDFNEYCVS